MGTVNMKQFILAMIKQGITFAANGDKLVLKGPVKQLDATQRQTIKDNKAAILAFVNETRQQQQARPIVKRAADVKPVMSFAQQRLWFIDQLNGGSSAEYNMPAAFLVEGAFDVNAASQAIGQIIERHQILRTVYMSGEENGASLQLKDSSDFAIELHDLSALPADEQQVRLKGLQLQDSEKPFDLSQDLMVRASYIMLAEQNGRQQGALLFNMHHIASDGWSMDIFVREFVHLYQAKPLPALEIQYADYAHWQREGAPLDAQLDYWEKQLADAPPVHHLVEDKTRPEQKQFVGAKVTSELSADVAGSLQQLARSHQLTPFMLLHGALALVLSRHSNSHDIVIGAPVANRLEAQLEPLIGFFINTLVLRLNTDHHSLVDYLAHVRQTHLEAQANQQVPFEQLVERLNVPRSTAYAPLFQITLSADTNFALGETADNDLALSDGLGDVSLSPLTVDSVAAKFDLDINISIGNNGVALEWKYDIALFDAVQIEQLNDHLCCLLNGLATLGSQDSQQALVKDLPVLPAKELNYLLNTLNDTAADYPKAQCLHQLFEAQAKLHPDNIALEFADPVAGITRLTYQALNQRANQVASYLREHFDIQPDTLIGLCVERSLEMVVGILAILKTGGAYVPVDTNHPQSRIDYVLESAGLSVVLSQTLMIEKINLTQYDTVNLNSDCFDTYPEHNLEIAGLNGSQLAYVIYTSGSTGQPKGVMVEQHSVTNLITGLSKTFGFKADEAVLWLLSYFFDASVEQLFIALLNGAKLVIPTLDDISNPPRIKQLIAEQGVTHLHATTSYLDTLEGMSNHQIRRVLFGGEICLQSLKDRWGELLVNEYGPTEATITSIQKMNFYHGNGLNCIGNPVQNTQVYVLDKNLQCTPRGVVGELYIGGAGLARGYLNQPELTAERFIDNPFGHQQNSRLYKTGDLVQYQYDKKGGPDNLAFVGRIDEQVKIRGFRIELGEIEYQISRCDGVVFNVVLAREDTPGQKRLVAYIAADNEGLIATVKAHLKSALPAYMVPVAFVLLAELPLTSNGKVDKKALPLPDLNVQQSDYIAPSTEAEKALAEIWAGLLKLDRDSISVTGNFFELGGDSILSIQLVSRAAQAGLHFSVKDLFQSQTIQGVALLAKSAALVSAPQHSMTGQQILLPVQRQFFNDPVDLHHYNQSVMLTTPVGFDEAALRQMVKALVQRHDALRMQFIQQDDRQDDQWIANYLPLTPELVDAAIMIKPFDDIEAMANEALANRVQRSLNIEKGQLFKAVLIGENVGESIGEQRLMLVIHHLVVDGVSWRVILQDIETLYSQLQAQKPLNLPAKTSSYQQWGAFLSQYSETLDEERQYWSERQNVPVLAIADLTANQGDELASGMGAASFTLEETLTSRLLGQSQQSYRTQINELLLAGLLLAVNRWGGSDTLRLDLEGHGREMLDDSLDLSQTVGWFTSVYPLTLAGAASLPELINGVKEAYRSIPNKGIGFGVLKHLVDMPSEASELVFNYLGQFDQVVNNDTHFTSAAESTGCEASPARQLSHALSINGMVAGGQLGFSLSYNRATYHDLAMQQLMDTFAQALTDIVAHCGETAHGLYSPSDFPLFAATTEQFNQWPVNEKVEDIWPATSMQQGLLFHSLLTPGNYVTQTLLRFSDLNVAWFKTAWQQLVQRHSIFRTAFVGLTQGNGHQLVYREVTLPWHEVDLSQLDKTAQAAQIEAIRAQDKLTNFTPEQAPLMRMTLMDLGGDEYQLIWAFHHALLDGWCLPLVFSEVTEGYRALQQGDQAKLPVVAPYRRYAAWLVEQDKRSASDFWREQMADITAPTPLPLAQVPTDEPGIEDWELTLDEADTASLVSLAQSTRTTVNVILQAAWGLLLSRYNSSESKVVFGAVTSGRPPQLPGAETMLGLFINSLPVVMHINPDTTVTDWLQTVHQQLIEREAYSYFPLLEIQNLSGLSQGLFDSLLVFENYPVNEAIVEHITEAGLTVEAVQTVEETSYDLSLIARLNATLTVTFEGQKSLFDSAALQQLAGHLKTLLLGFSQLKESPLSDITMLGKAEAEQLLYGFNQTETEYPHELCLHELFEAKVQQQPDHTALIFDGQTLTYQQLNQRANHFARELRAQGVTADTLVGISVERSMEMVVAILAILKAGGAYVPLDPTLPAERLQYMREHTGIKHQVNDADLQAIKVESDTTNLGRIAGQNSGNLAYVLYTSGSTGVPKGVAMPQSALSNLLAGMRRDCEGLQQPVDMLQYSSLGFDMSFTEIFLSLLSGGTLLLMDKSWQLDPARLVQGIVDNKLSALNLPYAMLPLIAQHCNTQQISFEHLKVIISTAEQLKITPAISQFFARQPQLRLVNHYGPSETHVVTTYKLPDNVKDWPDTPPIGQPIQNIQAYVLDEQLQPVPFGASGGLYIGGAGLARGYLHQPALTAERFIDNPFKQGQYDSPYLYQTGDLVKRLPAGELSYSGRADGQVKIRGFRIELPEIEHQLGLCQGVASTVVVASEQHLLAYVVAEDGVTLNEATLHNLLVQNLPEYMLPSAYVMLPALPLTTNGKVDHKALPEVDGTLLQGEYSAPQNDIERTLCQIWAKLLKLDAAQISTQGNFFVLGGHSLLVVRLVADIRQQLAVEVEIKTVFEQATIEQLAQRIRKQQTIDFLQQQQRQVTITKEGSL